MSFTGSTSKFTLGYQVLIAIIAGILVGLWLGPNTKYLGPFAEAFGLSLRMFALPYILFSVVHGLGSLTPKVARQLLRKGIVILLILCCLIFALIYLFSALIPKALVSPMELNVVAPISISEQLLGYLVPKNLFSDFSNNVVPAIAVISITGGIAVMHLSDKEPLLGILERGNEVIEKIFMWIAIISPIGIFAHVAVAAGTLDMAQVKKLGYYFVGYIGITLAVVFYFFPTLICSLTSFRYREVMHELRTACLLGFATGLTVIAIPFIVRSVNKLAIKDPAFRSVAQTTIPVGLTFAQLGNYLILFFMLFISFYYRHPFTVSEKVLLPILTIPMSLGSPTVSISALSFFVLKWSFPQSANTLFLQITAFTGNMQVLISVSAVFTYSVLVLLSYFGRLQVNLKKLAAYWGIGFCVLCAILWLMRGQFTYTDSYAKVYQDLRIVSPVKATFVPAENRPDEDVMVRILRTGVLRVGVNSDEMPYTYINNKHQLVGYDVAFAYKLAEDLGCKLEFVPLTWGNIVDELNNNQYDIGMSAILVDQDRIEKMDFTNAYYSQKNVLVVRAHRRKEFRDYDSVYERTDLKIGVEGDYEQVAIKYLPNATKERITIEKFPESNLDAFVYSYVPAVVWCYVHPEYVVMEYGDKMGSRYFSYAVKRGSWNWLTYLNHWLDLKKLSGFTKEQFEYWIGGDVPKALEE